MADIMDLDGQGWDDELFEDIFGETPEIVKLLVFLIDCSGSMEGTTIGSVNSIMEEVLSELEKEKSHKRVSIVSFDEKVHWSAEKPQTLEELAGWKRIHAKALSNMGEALKQLGKKLVSPDWCQTGKKGISGIFIMFSDGMATDCLEEGMDAIRRAPLFQQGKKMAINFSEYWDKEVLETFVGEGGTVLHMKNNDVNLIEQQILALINE